MRADRNVSHRPVLLFPSFCIEGHKGHEIERKTKRLFGNGGGVRLYIYLHIYIDRENDGYGGYVFFLSARFATFSANLIGRRLYLGLCSRSEEPRTESGGACFFRCLLPSLSCLTESTSWCWPASRLLPGLREIFPGDKRKLSWSKNILRDRPLMHRLYGVLRI